MLSGEQKERLKDFNELAEILINSDYIKEAKQRWIGGTHEWNMNDDTGNLDHSFRKESHNETNTRALILTLRLTVQDNEQTSLRNMANLYEQMSIDDSDKTEFGSLRSNFNSYLDSPTIISENNEPTRRQILEALMWGEYAHRNPDKREVLKLWSKAQPHWDMVYNQFEMILHECITTITKIKELNERVLEKYC